MSLRIRRLSWLLLLSFLAGPLAAAPAPPARPLPGLHRNPGEGGAVGISSAIAANGATVVCPVNEQGTAAIEVTGTWVGTLQFEDSVGGVTFTSLRCLDPATDTPVTSATGNGLWTAPVAGLGVIRVRASAWTSGTANIVVRASPAASTVRSTNVGTGGGGGGGAVTVADGADVTQGATTDAAAGDAPATVNAHLRQIAKQLAATVAVTGSGSFAVTQADGSSVTLGALADAAVGDGTASVNAHLRQIAKLLAATQVVSGSGNFATTAADGSSVTLGALADAAVGDVSGSVNAHIRQVAKALAGTLTVSGTVTANQGTANTTANGWPAKITDGTNVAAVKAASTAAVATDPAAVVTLSPNTALPAGANALGSVTVTGTSTVAGTVTANQGTANGAGTSSWPVQGAAASGSAVAGNPLLIGASDGTNSQTAKTATAATGTTGTGLLGMGTLLWDAVGGVNFVKQSGDGSGRAMMVGAAATGAAVAGNPVLLGAQDSSGNVSPLLLSSTGPSALRTYITSATGTALAVQTFGDAAGAVSGLPVGAYQLLFNGATNDRQRNNVDVTLLASGARTTTQTSADIITYNAHSIICTLDVTSAGTGSVTLTINYKDPASGKYILLLSGAAVTTNTTNVYTINPNIPAVPAVSAQKDLGRVIQIVLTSNNANTVTDSVGYTLIN